MSLLVLTTFILTMIGLFNEMNNTKSTIFVPSLGTLVFALFFWFLEINVLHITSGQFNEKI